jgi:hypothetical protein
MYMSFLRPAEPPAGGGGAATSATKAEPGALEPDTMVGGGATSASGGADADADADAPSDGGGHRGWRLLLDDGGGAEDAEKNSVPMPATQLLLRDATRRKSTSATRRSLVDASIAQL